MNSHHRRERLLASPAVYARLEDALIGLAKPEDVTALRQDEHGLVITIPYAR